MMTKRQAALLELIDRRTSETGVCPSYREMAEEVGLKSPSRIHELINGLEFRGLIRRIPGRARAIEVLRLPGVKRYSPAEIARLVPRNDTQWWDEFMRHLGKDKAA